MGMITLVLEDWRCSSLLGYTLHLNRCRAPPPPCTRGKTPINYRHGSSSTSSCKFKATLLTILVCMRVFMICLFYSRVTLFAGIIKGFSELVVCLNLYLNRVKSRIHNAEVYYK